ncbi:MAG: hypothetical protein OZSIB_0261 [Candidatus Ozemobacter sibiricus]|uniref:Uncharacterized protein n=1 Tax=Candidatus Ozemobacter sibiricus TaxID=2268124 RepID=A0A367ZMR2_9BACT|nr:MAG: hypothetical protein OZSIB_0261 [Candidatus Ozemobacter sibiricus]
MQELVLVPGKMTQEGSSDMDILFASAKGTGISGGWIENQQGVKLPGSDLLFESVTGRYERLLTRTTDGFPPGTYVLKYLQGGETKEYKPHPLSWTVLPRFPSAPVKMWDAFSRTLTVQFSPIPGAAVRYFLRLYNPNTGVLRKETFDTAGTEIREYVPDSGELQVMLVGDIREGDSLKARILHFFQPSPF